MIRQTLAIIILLVFTAPSVLAQQSEVLALLTEADWCGICKKHNARTQTNFHGNNQDGFFRLVEHDLTDENTDEKTMSQIEELGIAHLVDKYNTTGVLVFVDNQSKKVIMAVSIKKSDDKLESLMSSLRESYKEN